MPLVRPWCVACCSALAIAALVLGIVQTAWPWMVDDAFISLRFADRLAHGQGLGWTDGERVEGYSNLLWVLASASLIALGIDGTTAVRMLGVGCTVAMLVVLASSRMIPPSWPARLAVVVAASLGAASTWATAGLEGPLLMLLLAVALSSVARVLAGDADARRASLLAGGAFALVVWTRPDGPLWIATTAAVVLLHERGRAGRGAATRSHWPWLLVLPAAAFAAQIVFRFAYYGDWLPNTAHAKLGSTSTARAAGLAYVVSNAAAMRALLLPAALAVPALFVRSTRWPVMLCGAGAVAWWLYVLLVGGDAFPRGRLLVPSLVPLTMLAAHGLGWLAYRGRKGLLLAWAAVVGCVLLASHDARSTGDDPRQRLSTWEAYGIAAGQWLGSTFAASQPLLAVDAAGAVPYFSRLPCLDMLGLCDRTIAHTPFPADAAFVPGHSRANGPYVLSRRPDLVVFGTPPGTPRPQWLGGRQMEADPQFLADYRVVLFDVGDVTLPAGTLPIRIVAWARLTGRLGARADAAAPACTVVPGFWLGCYRQPYSFGRAELEPDRFDRERFARDVQAGAQWLLAPGTLAVAEPATGMPAASVQRAGRHVVPSLPVAPGRYRVRAPDLPEGVALSLQRPDGASLADGAGAFCVPASAGAVAIDVVCDVPADAAVPFRIRHFVLERVE